MQWHLLHLPLSHIYGYETTPFQKLPSTIKEINRHSVWQAITQEHVFLNYIICKNIFVKNHMIIYFKIVVLNLLEANNLKGLDYIFFSEMYMYIINLELDVV